MTLPPHAINALVDIKRELLASAGNYSVPVYDESGALTEQRVPAEYVSYGDGASRILPAPPPSMREEPEHRTPERTMRHARRRSGGFQRMCQEGHW